MKVQFFYRKDTLQIDHFAKDCISGSTAYVENPDYVEVRVTDPPYEVTRNHRVVLDAKGNVVGTEPSLNPRKDVPELRTSLHEAKILAFDAQLTRPVKVKLVQGGNEFDVDCYVTQDLVDAYRAGRLKVGDWVLVYFIDRSIDKAIAQQKIFKTW